MLMILFAMLRTCIIIIELKNMYRILILRVWSNGRIPPCQGEGTGSIPVTRLFIQKFLTFHFNAFSFNNLKN